MQDKLNALNESSNDIQASAIFTLDGLIIASTLSSGSTDEVGAIAAAMQALASRTTELLQRGNLMQVQVQGDHGYMVVSTIGHDAVLVTLTRPHANMGLVLHEIKRFQQSCQGAE